MYAARRKVLSMLYDHELTAQEAEELLEAMEIAPASIEPSVPRPELIGDSEWSRQFLKTLDKISDTQSPVLIQGESGTGKYLVAQMLHYQSRRASDPFIHVHCGATPEPLIESELFGHEKGAFTGAVARKLGKVELVNGGTLFLDEIDSLPLDTQVKLLRLLEERTFERVGGTQALTADVRIVAVTHLDLKKRVDEGRFRSDLYYRLSVACLQTAPLRDRREDIPTMVVHFLQRKARRDEETLLEVSREAMEILSGHDWPGNVAELANVIEKAAVQCEGSRILPEHVSDLAA